MVRPYSNNLQRTNETLKKTLLIIAVTGVVIAGYTTVKAAQKNNTLSQAELYNPVLVEESNVTIAPSPVASPLTKSYKKIDVEKLKTEINTLIDSETPPGSKWVFSVVVTDLETKDQVKINETEPYDAASVGKLPILLAIFEQIKKGEIKETENITVGAADIQDYGTGSLRYKKTPLTLTVKELAVLMIKESDNTAAHVLANKVGRDNIKSYVQRLGMVHTDTEENTTTPEDTDILLNHLYSMKETSPSLAGTVMNIMTDSLYEQRLPGLLPQEVIVAHKIGTGIAQIHDVGIVLLEERPYAISVFSKQINDETKTEEIIAKISKQVFDEIKAVE